MNTIKMKKKNNKAKLPSKSTAKSAYSDIQILDDAYIGPGGQYLFDTGLEVQVPQGYFLDIRPRSALNLNGIVMANAPSVIDADFKGNLKIVFVNIGKVGYKFKSGDKVAQCALMSVVDSDFVEDKT